MQCSGLPPAPSEFKSQKDNTRRSKYKTHLKQSRNGSRPHRVEELPQQEEDMAAFAALQMCLSRHVINAVRDYLRLQILKLMEVAETEVCVALSEYFPTRSEVRAELNRMFKRQREDDGPDEQAKCRK